MQGRDYEMKQEEITATILIIIGALTLLTVITLYTFTRPHVSVGMCEIIVMCVLSILDIIAALLGVGLYVAWMNTGDRP